MIHCVKETNCYIHIAILGTSIYTVVCASIKIILLTVWSIFYKDYVPRQIAMITSNIDISVWYWTVNQDDRWLIVYIDMLCNMCLTIFIYTFWNIWEWEKHCIGVNGL